MSAELDKARDLFASGEDKQALGALKRVESGLHSLMIDGTLSQDDKQEAEELLGLAAAIRERNHGRIRRGTESLISDARSYLDLIGRRPVAIIDTLASCRAQTCEPFEVSPDADIVLEFTTEAALVKRRHRDGLELLGSLGIHEINRIEFEELPDPASAPRQAGRAALAISAELLFSGGSTLLETHTVQVTLVTSRGRIALLHKSGESQQEVQKRLAPVLDRITN